MNKSYIDSIYYLEYKKIRNKIRKYDSILLLNRCIEFLNDPKIEIVRKLPWHVLLLIKWIFVDDQFPQTTKINPSKKDLEKLINDINRIEGEVIKYQKFDNLHILLKRFAYQQFYYQERFNIFAFARQLILFGDLEKNHYFKKIFFKKTGLNIHEFIKNSNYLLHHINNKGYYHISSNILNEQNFKAYLRVISLDLASVNKWVKQVSKKEREPSEFYEPTMLLRYPLIEIDEKYYIYHKNLLNRSLEYFIYDVLKMDNPNLSMSKFGIIFENYIDKLISYSGVNYIRENELTNIIGNKSKIVDFIIQQGESSILVDAKGVEMHYRGKTSLDPDFIKGKIKTSAIKAIEQAFASIHELRKVESYKFMNKFNNNYLLVVTYKELFLGNGIEFEQRIGKDFFRKIRKEYGDELYIPLQNIYFITVDSLEFWVEMVNKNKITFLDVLRNAIECDSDSSTQKFHFQQHLEGMEIELDAPDFIYKSFKEL
tara:strand:- start:257 stop:1708 length:1452 start_codon:yes stop_codon:yes gene_type:complete